VGLLFVLLQAGAHGQWLEICRTHEKPLSELTAITSLLSRKVLLVARVIVGDDEEVKHFTFFGYGRV
jgi:hypothetical protein